MKTVLISMHGSTGKLMPPLGLMYLATSIRQIEGVEPVLLDEGVLPHNSASIERAAEHIISLDPDVLCFTAMTEQHIILLELIHQCRVLSEKRILVIVGGPHATLAPESCALTLGADCIFRGPGEGLLMRILSSLRDHDREWEGCRVVSAPHGDIINLDLSDYLPDRGSTDLNEYQFPYTIMTARGCPGRCSFCSSPVINDGIVRTRTIASIRNEIDSLVKELDAKRIVILDDSFTQSETRLRALCEILGERGIIWFCESRLDCVNAQKLKMMREAGCTEIQFGIECFDQSTLDKIGKTIRADSIRDTLGAAVGQDIKVAISLMIGLPGDTVRSVRERVNVATHLADLGVSTAEFGLFRPFPGTAIYRNAEELGYGDIADWWEQDCDSPLCFPSSSMTRSDLIGMMMYAKYKMKEAFGSSCSETWKQPFRWRPKDD